jgi:hypothetical protein
VLHAGRAAVYLEVDGGCLGVLAAGAVQVPCGVRTTLPRLPEIDPHGELVVHDGIIQLPGCDVLVSDIVDHTVPVLSPAGVAWGAQQLDRLTSSRLGAIRAALPAGALADLAARDTGGQGAVLALLGLGPGLTPLGDDVLCGWLSAAVASRHPGLDDVRSTVLVESPKRTTKLSAALLGCASCGEAVPELRALLRAIATQELPVVEESVATVLRIGETSGGGLLLGALLALESLR